MDSNRARQDDEGRGEQRDAGSRGGRPSPCLARVHHPANAAATREPGTFAY